jgi:NAD(P)-dependent dehydrogenase (short-subunit alcohol dehydrogenase family)
MKNILITGVSSGIGYETARFLTEKGNRVFGSTRSDATGDQIKQKFGENFIPLTFDVRDKAAIAKAVDSVTSILGDQGLDVLINNAGVAIPGPLSHFEEADFDNVFNINVKGLMQVTNSFLPLLGAHLPPKGNPGKIINISSVSGIFSAPFNGVYAMSKHAVESMTDAYRRELMIYGIDVISIQPGPIKTDIWNKAKGVAEKYKHTDYAEFMKHANKIINKMEEDALPVQKISILINKIIESANPKTKYLVHKKKFLFKLMAYYLPDRFVDRLIKKNLMGGNKIKPV